MKSLPSLNGLCLFIVPLSMLLLGCTKHTLRPNETLETGDSLVSQNKQFVLRMQEDGNLVLGRMNEESVWSTQTSGMNVQRCVMQEDGNLVLYDGSGQAKWSSKTNGFENSFLILQDNADLVIYHDSQEVWATHTWHSQ